MTPEPTALHLQILSDPSALLAPSTIEWAAALDVVELERAMARLRRAGVPHADMLVFRRMIRGSRERDADLRSLTVRLRASVVARVDDWIRSLPAPVTRPAAVAALVEQAVRSHPWPHVAPKTPRIPRRAAFAPTPAQVSAALALVASALSEAEAPEVSTATLLAGSLGDLPRDTQRLGQLLGRVVRLPGSRLRYRHTSSGGRWSVYPAP